MKVYQACYVGQIGKREWVALSNAIDVSLKGGQEVLIEVSIKEKADVDIFHPRDFIRHRKTDYDMHFVMQEE